MGQVMSMFSTKRTVGDIVEAFQRTISDLESVEKTHRDEAKDKRERAETLVIEANAAAAEADRARDVATNLRTLIKQSEDLVEADEAVSA